MDALCGSVSEPTVLIRDVYRWVRHRHAIQMLVELTYPQISASRKANVLMVTAFVGLAPDQCHGGICSLILLLKTQMIAFCRE
jgi:hypothetical protein